MYGAIVVGTDGSSNSAEAVRRAAAMAAATGAHLHVVSAWSTPPTPYAAGPEVAYVVAQSRRDWGTQVREGIDAMLDELRERLCAQGVRVSTHAVRAHPVPALLEAARRHHADLIVVGNKGMRGARRVLGSVPNAVSHKADCDVLIVDST